MDTEQDVKDVLERFNIALNLTAMAANRIGLLGTKLTKTEIKQITEQALQEAKSMQGMK